MNVTVYSSKAHDRRGLSQSTDGRHEFTFLEAGLCPATAKLAVGSEAVCLFVNDDASAPVLEQLAAQGVKSIALRCAGFNNVNLAKAEELGISVARVPAYSPHAVAEHAVAIILCLNRRLHKAYNRVREGNFELRGLEGFDLYGKTVGVIGTGKIGEVFCRIMSGFGCRVLAYDPSESDVCLALGVQYTSLEELLKEADIVSLHCPLMPETHHLINAESLGLMKDGVMLINTSRGALVNTRAALEGLKSGKIGTLGLDVYEEEAGVFFEDLSGAIINDDVLMRLTTFPNVLITSHQAFFTHEALGAIAQITVQNLDDFAAGQRSANFLTRA